MNDSSPQNWISFLQSGDESKDLSQIVETSLAKMVEIREKYLKNEMDQTEYINLTDDITDLTLIRISNREKTIDNLFKPLLRLISYAFSPLKIPYFEKFDEEDQKFKETLASDRLKISQANDDNVKEMVVKKIKNLTPLFQELKERFNDERKKELINIQLVADWQEYEKTPAILRHPYMDEFERDINNGARFLRKDPALKIDDTVPLPLIQTDPKQRVQKASFYLQELLKKPDDQRWATILQIAATHATFITAFRYPLSIFNIDASKFQWQSKGKYYSIKSVFSKLYAPNVLEVIRSPQTGIIEKVNVTIKGSMDIVRSSLSVNEETVKIILPDALKEELQFSIIFAENKQPAIQDLLSRIETNIPSKMIR